MQKNTRKVAPDGGWGWAACFGVSLVNVSIVELSQSNCTISPEYFNKLCKNLSRRYSVFISIVIVSPKMEYHLNSCISIFRAIMIPHHVPFCFLTFRISFRIIFSCPFMSPYHHHVKILFFSIRFRSDGDMLCEIQALLRESGEILNEILICFSKICIFFSSCVSRSAVV